MTHQDLIGSGLTGSLLASLLEECGIRVIEDCECNDWVRWMDEWGPDGCDLKIPVIVIHLKKAEHDHGLSISKKISVGVMLLTNGVRPTTVGLVELAIKLSRRATE